MCPPREVLVFGMDDVNVAQTANGEKVESPLGCVYAKSMDILGQVGLRGASDDKTTARTDLDGPPVTGIRSSIT
jgi:hypothetical protein